MAFNEIDGIVFDKNKNYLYKNVELTPNVFANILVHLFDGKQFKRQTAIENVVKFHIDNGGISHRDEYISTFKHMAIRGAIKDCLTNVGYGTWMLQFRNENKEVELIESNDDNTVDFIVDEELGEGDGTVYVYYFEVYKERAILNNRNVWECKIGMTDRNALARIFSQSSTAYPEYPHIAILIHCQSARTMETALHSALKLRGQWIKESPGAEWFLTSPDEVKQLYYAIVGI